MVVQSQPPKEVWIESEHQARWIERIDKEPIQDDWLERIRSNLIKLDELGKKGIKPCQTQLWLSKRIRAAQQYCCVWTARSPSQDSGIDNFIIHTQCKFKWVELRSTHSGSVAPNSPFVAEWTSCSVWKYTVCINVSLCWQPETHEGQWKLCKISMHLLITWRCLGSADLEVLASY